MSRAGIQSVIEGVLLLAVGASCQSIRNGWLDPSVVGSFGRTTTLDIRDSLSLEEEGPGIPGESSPTLEDQQILIEEYPITAGDVLAIEINELRERFAPFQAQVQVTNTGYVNLPAVGRIQAAGLTTPEFEERVIRTLKDKQVLLEPEVTVNPQTLQRATFSIFGIGVSAANNAPLRAGTFPIRRPDLRILEAINQIGGLNEFVTEVYVFRYDRPEGLAAESSLGDGSADFADRSNTKDDARRSDTEAPVSSAVENAPLSDNQKKLAQQELEGAINPPGTQPFREDVAASSSAQTGSGERGLKASNDEFARMSPDPLPPYLWVDSRWIANPAYQDMPEPRDVLEGSAKAPEDFSALRWARIAGDSNYRIIRIPAESLRSGDPERNIYVRAGDVIRIVSGEFGIYYVMGQVNRVGAFPFNAEPITLKSAIATAGGLGGLAWPDRCTVYRRVGSREQVLPVNLDRVFAGLDEDFFIRRGDIINVGTHPFAPFLQRIRAWTLPNPVNNIGYSFTYSRNFADLDSYAVKQNPANRPDRFPNLFP